jgi:hypothetical protein
MERNALARSVTLCISAFVVTAAVTQAQTIDLSLNLRYNDPADSSEGGVWYLVAKTTGGSPNAGIAAVNAYLTNINPVAFHGSTVPLPAGQNPAHGAYPVVGQATINNLSNGGSPFNAPVFGGAHNVLYGQDISTGPPSPPAIIGGIGQGSGAGNVAIDPLKNSDYDNYAVLLSGTFGATRPAFAPMSGFTITDGNVLASTTAGTGAIDAIISASNLHVRGDSLVDFNLNSALGQGLLRGDVNRDFIVNEDDLNIVLLRFQDGPGLGWDQGDVNDDGWVDENDLNQVLLHFADASAPPGISAAIAPASEAIGAAAPTPGLGGDFDGNGQVDGSDWLLWQRGQSPVPLSAGDLATWQSDYGAGNEVAAAAVPLAGDFNGDGEVSGPDLAIWRPSFIARNANGDADGDGDTDGGDILIWQRGIGQPAATASISAVPEPHAVGLMILGAFTLGTGCRRRRLRPH